MTEGGKEGTVGGTNKPREKRAPQTKSPRKIKNKRGPHAYAKARATTGTALVEHYALRYAHPTN